MTQPSAFQVSKFTNPSGEIVFRIAGWLNGARLRKNFSTRAEAEAERQALEIESAQESAGITDIIGLRTCGIFPSGKEPSIRTLREWTKLHPIPHHRVGHFVYYDEDEVGVHIRTELKVPARG